jgi:DNA-directed RNA polymerase subunit N (RpoN/RPB10)
MASFIRCPSCGFTIGLYTKFFDQAKHSLFQKVLFSGNAEYSEYDPEKLALNPGSVPPLEEIFDALEIKNRCCRARLTTKTDFDNTYK